MNNKLDLIKLNTERNFCNSNQIKSYHNKTKISPKNEILNQSSLNNTTSENHTIINVSVSLPLSALKSRLLSPKIFINPIDSALSSSNSKAQMTPLKQFNNTSIYYSKHKNTKKSNYIKNTDKKDLKINGHNKENFVNNYQNSNNKLNPNKLMYIKNNNTSYNFKNINKQKKIYENSKNNNSSIDKDKKINIYSKCINPNFCSNYTSGKENDRIKNFKFKDKKNIYNDFPKKKLSNLFSPDKLLLSSQKMPQKTQRLYANNCKNNLQKNIFAKIEPKIINPEEFKTLNKIGFGTFGEIYKVIWNQNNENYAMKTMHTQNQDNILYIQEKTKLIIDFQQKTKCDGLIKIFGDTYIKKGKDYYYYVIMEIADRDWEKEIIRRKSNMLYYSERELFLIMSQLIKTLSLLQKNHITHRDIKLQNILLIKNKFKICDFGEARKLVQKGTIVQPVRGSELYMSPIQFYGLNNNLKLVQHNTYKSDVFSLGMCILFAATLSDNCLYDIRELTNMNIIFEILERYLRKRYSIGFIRLLMLLLEVDERKRPDFIQLENIIYQITQNN